MKKLIVLAVVALVFGIVSGAYASATDWLIYLKATDQVGANPINTGVISGLKTGALDGYDAANDAQNSAGSGAMVVLGSFDLGVGSGYGYYKDLRSPTSTNLTWNLKLFLQANCNASGIKLTGWNPSGTYDLVAPQMKVSIPALGLSYVFDGTTNGTSSAPQFTWTIENAQNYKGIENALNVILAPVPEPGSIVALASGLVGLVGFGIRRRK